MSLKISLYSCDTENSKSFNSVHLKMDNPKMLPRKLQLHGILQVMKRHGKYTLDPKKQQERQPDIGNWGLLYRERTTKHPQCSKNPNPKSLYFYQSVQQRNMAQETNHSQVPMLCSTGCGFYGNPRTNGMCSVCYKEHLQRQNSSNGRISPPAPSVSSLSESLPVQCTDGSVPETQSALDSTSSSMQPSPVSNQSLLSESVASSQVDSTSVDKAIPGTEDLQGILLII
ncbi:hypothetical protein E2I00_016439, partial [Balaenoptera physalus]